MLRGDILRSLGGISRLHSSLLLTTNYCNDYDAISWPAYKPGIFAAMPYAVEYQKLVDDRQFSFLIRDKSFFQFYYKWDGETLKSARLAYYPSPLKISGAMDELLIAAEESGVDILEDMYLGAHSWAEQGIDLLNCSHLRLDYDSSATSHSQCHLQFAAINEFRIESKVLLNPFIFFEWVVSSIEKSGYESNTQKAPYPAEANYLWGKVSAMDHEGPSRPHIIL